jgi:hypothetical protein
MLVDHRYSRDEAAEATGLSLSDLDAAVSRLGLDTRRLPDLGDTIRIRPYPGGRDPYLPHPDVIEDMRRETKVSVFAPWDPTSYVVADIPEAIWENETELLYLAHRHVTQLDRVASVWDRAGVVLETAEWSRPSDRELTMTQTLPDGVVFGTNVVAEESAVRMEIWLRNGSTRDISGLQLQNCLLFKGAPGFQAPIGYNRVAQSPYVAAPIEPAQDRWVITAWEPVLRIWTNPVYACIHSDPTLPDCAVGETVRTRGWLSFFEGRDVRAEFARIEALRWWEDPVGATS